MDDAPVSNAEPPPRPHQLSLALVLGTVVFFAAAFTGSQWRNFGNLLVTIAAPVVAVSANLVLTRGAATRGVAIGFGVGILLWATLIQRFEIRPVDLFGVVGLSTWFGAALGAAERGHRYVGWITMISAGLFIALVIR